MASIMEMVGQRFGRLTVLKETESDKWGIKHWLCQCTCGNYITVRGTSLRAKHTQSCGCLHRELTEDPSYATNHFRIKKNKTKPELCEKCRERSATDLSYNNTTDKRHSQNPEDYEWLCQSCHSLKDRSNGTVLTKARIHRIREFYACEAATTQELADLFKVSRRTISNIINYEKFYKEPINPDIFKELVKGLEGIE